jgi:hypothetical protein
VERNGSRTRKAPTTLRSATRGAGAFAKASEEDVNHSMSKGFVDKIKQMFG